MEIRSAFILLISSLFIAFPLWGMQTNSATVKDSSTGKVLHGVLVRCGSEFVYTDEQGVFSTENAGQECVARAPGYLPYRTSSDFSGNIALTPFNPKALYLSFFGVAEPILRDPALKLIEDTELNALVIDVKGDRGMIPYPSGIKKAEEIGAQKVITVRDMEKLLTSFKERGIYTIARIVVFKDNLLARAHPEFAVKRKNGKLWRDGERLSWVDPFSPEVWQYNVDLAEEAARLGFDEIQFDYVRFPEKQGLVFSKESTEENRVAAISEFLAAAKKRLEPYDVFLSADVFGYVCWNRNDTRIGQRLEELVSVLDYVSPMLYPSGFTHGVGMYRNPVEHPYETVFLSLNNARKRTGLSPLRFRPWLQAFRDYAFDRRHFDADEVKAQTRAADEFGSSGWMLWNARNVYEAEGLNPNSMFEAKLSVEGASVVR